MSQDVNQLLGSLLGVAGAADVGGAPAATSGVPAFVQGVNEFMQVIL